LSINVHATLPALELPATGRGGAPIKKSQLWQRSTASRVLDQARERAGGLVAEVGQAVAVDRLVGYVERRRRDSSPGAQLDAFCHALATLELEPTDPEVAIKLHAWGRSILAESIDPRRSRVAELHAALEAAAARVARLRRDTWEAAWLARLAQLSETDRGGEALWTAAELALLVGDAPSLVARFASQLDGAGTGEIRLVRARWLRLSGRAAEARALLDAAAGPAVTWERACCDAVIDGSLSPLASALRDREIAGPERHLDFWLWAHAVRTKRYRARALQLSTLQRKLGADHVGLRCARAIASLTRKSSRPLARIREVGRALHAVAGVESTQRELLLWAAAARCLRQAKQPRFAALAAARYRSLSRLASAGRSADVLATAADIELGGDVELPSWEELEVSARDARVPARVRDRYVAFGRLVTDVLLARVRAVRGDRADTARELSQLIADHLGHLKGPMMKIGQVLSHYGLGLGDDERALLASLHDSAPAVAFSELRGTVESELGPIAARFAELEPSPLATGSIGQVHRGRLPDGRPVAVKIQYPGVDRAVRADLAVLRVAAPLLDRLLPAWDVRGLIDELAALVIAETDYVSEAKNTRDFGAMFAGDPDIVIPAVIDSHSSRRVLTCELIEGVRVDPFAASATQGERDRAGARVARFISRCCFVERVFHTDPHPGNFLIAGDRVAVVDFGSVKRWRGDEGKPWFEVLEAIVASDSAALGAAFERMGMIGGRVDIDRVLEALQTWTMRWTTSVAGTGPTRFSVADVASEIRTWLGDPSLRGVVIQPADLYGFRSYWGMFALLARLGASVDLHAVTDEIRQLRRR
jgi:predicted unusual protein kinase regulating ubiquinone biosynthesis (AarF/ABC1/UbiB family)